MDVREVIESQYAASLEMLKQAILQCPDSMWNDDGDKNKFWQLAYHALFYTHLYLQPFEQAFTAWAKHRHEYEFMGPLPWPPHKVPQIGEPYTKEEVLEYHELCRQQVKVQVASVDLEANSSGFSWIPLGKLELQLYNIRHLQQHTGELCERLGQRAGIDIGWVGQVRS
jgi:hypothetical protein